MNLQGVFKKLILLLFIIFIVACKQKIEIQNDFLISFFDEETETCGYKNQDGEIIIPTGKYSFCFTDTFSTYAIVFDAASHFIAIDKDQKILYKVFVYDNGPDYVSEGLFRIIQDGKIGYADASNGKIIIKPQYGCAYPFENGKAKVSMDCTTSKDGEYSVWTSNNWFEIDKKGSKTGSIEENNSMSK